MKHVFCEEAYDSVYIFIFPCKQYDYKPQNHGGLGRQNLWSRIVDMEHPLGSAAVPHRAHPIEVNRRRVRQDSPLAFVSSQQPGRMAPRVRARRRLIVNPPYILVTSSPQAPHCSAWSFPDMREFRKNLGR
ncbi:hypothetical protein GALMADRAFT_741490 [Galerina marginata CBS 339.88]|uniref:Uncharacterized protein n=1 Tax=Galerina marginata (strain CBS 339.88) TaxID=685588 RepID=A0A067SZ18_GALM3|nr:hypothetical protein GALMADRAFT_741490 [Galerina marginata CBS 339.88]